jgi:archaellum component FlaC
LPILLPITFSVLSQQWARDNVSIRSGDDVNIDERLDRLTERHEALTQTVELLTHDISALKDIAATCLDSIKRLERINDLEGRDEEQ